MTDRNELIAALDGRIIGGHLHNGGYIHVPLEEAEQIYYMLTKQPEQKHGHWVRPPKFLSETQCSICKEIYVGDCRTFNYCPNCGAKMDEEVKQDD